MCQLRLNTSIDQKSVSIHTRHSDNIDTCIRVDEMRSNTMELRLDPSGWALIGLGPFEVGFDQIAKLRFSSIRLGRFFAGVQRLTLGANHQCHRLPALTLCKANLRYSLRRPFKPQASALACIQPYHFIRSFGVWSEQLNSKYRTSIKHLYSVQWNSRVW